jgi:tripartite-type tricarboxylate transporter receptor subunit TctC
VHLIVGFAAGGTADVSARLIGEWLSMRLGQPFVVENRTGAGGNIATEAVARAPTDGNTLLLCAPANAISATLYDHLSFNFIRDVAPVAGLLRLPNVLLVHPSLPASTVPEFIAYARANPGRINFASAGNGTGEHLAGELLKLMTGINMTHVPYRGGAPALTALLGGQVQAHFSVGATATTGIAAGMRPLAVTTATRSERLPNVPALAEYVPGYEVSTWYGIGAPANTPTAIVDRLNQEINAGLADRKIKGRFAELGGVPMPVTPAEFGKFIAAETLKWGKVIRAANIKAA